MSAKSSKRAKQPQKITTNRAIFAGVLVGTPDTDIMKTKRSAEHSVETRESPNIQISLRYSE
ncbi:22870_t:CDS:1, partial [Gigaspora rosea]